MDYDRDGITDLLFCGNINNARLRFGKADANFGLLLKGNKNGNFTAISQKQSGFNLSGDVRSVITIGDKILFGINQRSMRTYQLNSR
jgi:hypothetical protein